MTCYPFPQALQICARNSLASESPSRASRGLDAPIARGMMLPVSSRSLASWTGHFAQRFTCFTSQFSAWNRARAAISERDSAGRLSDDMAMAPMTYCHYATAPLAIRARKYDSGKYVLTGAKHVS